MRVYGYHAGSPGYISAEFGVDDQEWSELSDRWSASGGGPRRNVHLFGTEIPGEALTREELLEVSTRRRALLAWEAKDDSALSRAQAQESADHDAWSVSLDAEEGCKVAQAIMARGLPADECREHVISHLHRGCSHTHARPGLSLVN